MFAGIMGFVVVMAILAVVFGMSANLVGASTLPTISTARPDKAPYRFLRIVMRGRCKDTGRGNGLTVYQPLYLSFYYGSQPGQCNPQQNQQSQKISMVQGPATAGTAATGTPTVVGGVITAIAVAGGGTGYNQLVPPFVLIEDTGGGHGAYATATVNSAGVVTGFNIPPGGGGSGYTALTTTVTALTNGEAGFQGLVAKTLIDNVFAKDYINDGIYANWFDTPTDVELQVGSATLHGGAGVVPAGGYLTPTGDGGIGALGERLPLDNNVTIHKYTGEKGRSWSGKAWHPSCVPITFFEGDDMSDEGVAAWDSVKSVFYTPITDGVSVLYPIMVSQKDSQLSVNPTKVAWAPLILPGLDAVRGIYNPLVNNTIGENRRRRERHGGTF